MIIRLKYICYLFALLSLLGPGDRISLNCRNVNYIRENGWVTTVYQNKQSSKCYRFRQWHGITTSILSFRIRPIQLLRLYGKDVRTRLSIQSVIFLNISFIVLIYNMLYHHKKSILSHRYSYARTISSANYCLSCSIPNVVRNIMRNYLLTNKWTNQEIQNLAYSRESDALQSGLHGGHT
jgi:hypothetical protein